MIGAAIDTGALLKMLYTSLAASIGISIIFATAILGAIRAGELRRAGRRSASSAYAVLATIGVALVVAVMVCGVILVAQKS
jgi:uncharacterized membrane protein